MKKSLVLSLTSVGASSALMLASGCLPDAPQAAVTNVDAGSTYDGGVSLSARQMFNMQVLPLLSATCGACHSREVGVGPGFLKSANPDPTIYDPYLTVTNWNNFIVSEPDLSLLLTKGQHEGPALTISQYDSVLAWLQQEKKERDAVSVIPFKPQVAPFSITLSASKSSPKYNNVYLDSIDPGLTGAYIRFVATTLSTSGAGLEISDLRIVNVKPGSQPTDQRSIHIQSPLFVLWNNGTPETDPANSFSGKDLTVALNQNDPTPAGATGVLIVPGLLVLDDYRPGYALNIVFGVIELVKPVVGSNPCTANQLTSSRTTSRSRISALPTPARAAPETATTRPTSQPVST